jgi:hypothetical protein
MSVSYKVLKGIKAVEVGASDFVSYLRKPNVKNKSLDGSSLQDFVTREAYDSWTWDRKKKRQAEAWAKGYDQRSLDRIRGVWTNEQLERDLAAAKAKKRKMIFIVLGVVVLGVVLFKLIKKYF